MLIPILAFLALVTLLLTLRYIRNFPENAPIPPAVPGSLAPDTRPKVGVQCHTDSERFYPIT